MPRCFHRITAAGVLILLVLSLSACTQTSRVALESAKAWTEEKYSGVTVSVDVRRDRSGYRADLTGDVDDLTDAREIIDYWAQTVRAEFTVDFEWEGMTVPVTIHYNSFDELYND